MKVKPILEKVEVKVPSSSANVGLGFDTWCLGLNEPSLKVVYTPTTDGQIRIENRGPYANFLSTDPEKHAGGKALSYFLKAIRRKNDGAILVYEDEGYPPAKGLGRSGAESVGTIAAAVCAYGIKLSRNELIYYAGFGEPGAVPEEKTLGHLDNVSGATNGRFSIIAISPRTQRPRVYFYDVPWNLGIAIGHSSHEKAGGTEAARRVIREPVDYRDYILTLGRISAATAGLVTGDVDQFLEFLWDVYHEPRRADAYVYGSFNSAELYNELRVPLFKEYGVVANISGAGTNMQFLFNKRRDTARRRKYGIGIITAMTPYLEEWFEKKGIKMEIKPSEIAREGAYDYIEREYPNRRTPLSQVTKT